MSLQYQVNSDALQRNIKKMKLSIDAIDDRLYEATFDSILDVMTTAKEDGYAPHDTGNLRKSITISVDRAPNRIVGYVGSNLSYARIHEFGGYTGRNHSVFIQGKHYMKRAVNANKQKIKKRFKLKKLIKGL